MCSEFQHLDHLSLPATNWEILYCKKQKTHTYIGVHIHHDLKWNTRINRITTAASKTLGFVHRIPKLPPAYLWFAPQLCTAQLFRIHTQKNSHKRWKRSKEGLPGWATTTMSGNTVYLNSYRN